MPLHWAAINLLAFPALLEGAAQTIGGRACLNGSLGKRLFFTNSFQSLLRIVNPFSQLNVDISSGGPRALVDDEGGWGGTAHY